MHKQSNMVSCERKSSVTFPVQYLSNKHLRNTRCERKSGVTFPVQYVSNKHLRNTLF
jgi:TATA-binding protein-associated factor Taf7